MQYHAKPCHTMQYHAIPCNTMQYNAIPCNIMQYHAIPCNTMQYNAIPCNTMQYHAIPCNTMQYHAIPYNTMQYHAIPCKTMQYHAIPCNTMQWSREWSGVVVTSADQRGSQSFQKLGILPRQIPSLKDARRTERPASDQGAGRGRGTFKRQNLPPKECTLVRQSAVPGRTTGTTR